MQLQIQQEAQAGSTAPHRLRGAFAGVAPGAGGPAVPGAAEREAMAVAGLVSVLLLLGGLVAAGSPSLVPEILLAGSALVAIATVFVTVLHRSPGALTDSGYSRAELEEKIETLEDLRWQARDDADHLQALLDGQTEIIIERDSAGRVTFANRAFCNMFAVHLEDVLGCPFHPKVLARDHAPKRLEGGGDGLPDWARPLPEKIKAADDVRWIDWSHRWVGSAETGDVGLQSVGRDITDQRRHARDLARARDEARAADRAKSRFLASMSHEIRTPMNGILGMSGLLGETEQSAEQRTYTEAVRKSAMTLLELIDEILDFSKIEAGHVELASDPVDIVDCVQGAVELLAPRAYQKQLQLVWSIAPDMPRQFLGDETRLRQILLNLLGNAVKYTEAGGISVWVGTEPAGDDNDRIEVVIRDTGPGLSDEARARIFMEFERGVSDGAPHESGTGLGLAIAQRLAQRMGGGIDVTSTPGSGATFTLAVCLPRARNSARNAFAGKLRQRHVVLVSKADIERRTIANFLRAHDVAVTEANRIDDLATRPTLDGADPPDTILLDSATDPAEARPVLDRLARHGDIEAAVIVANGNRSELERFHSAGIENFLVRPIRPSTLLALLAGEIDQPPVPAVAPPADLAEPAAGARWRVLVAEDNEINALLTRTVITRLGSEAVVVPNGSEAIAEMARALAGRAPRVDAVLMDLHMPVMDGFAATARIHRLCDDAGVPYPVIIAVTANAFQEDRDRCLAAGMDDYLSKPFEPGDLRRILERLAVDRPRERRD